jgi:hypothetical protein
MRFEPLINRPGDLPVEEFVRSDIANGSEDEGWSEHHPLKPLHYPPRGGLSLRETSLNQALAANRAGEKEFPIRRRELLDFP